jgi:hypothetical protein
LEILSWIVFVLTYVALAGNGLGILIFWLFINRLLLLLIVYDFQKLELHVPLRVIALAVSLFGQFFFPIGNYGQAFFLSLILGVVCWGLFWGAKWYVNKVHKFHKVKANGLTEGFGQWDVMLGFLLGTLMPFIFSFNQISFTGSRISELVIIFFVLSSLLWLAWFAIQYLFKISSHIQALFKDTLFSFRMLPFIPFMIFAFWILLFAGKFFITLVFPRW